MHARNPFRGRLDLRSFEELREIVRHDGHIDWQHPDATRLVSATLLRHVYGLRWSVPPGVLVPPVPNRLNYVLVLEDLLASELRHDDWVPRATVSTITADRGTTRSLSDVIAVDVGTGASAIYALLAHAACGWKVVATDTDARAAEHAAALVSDNSLRERIRIMLVDPHGEDFLAHDAGCGPGGGLRSSVAVSATAAADDGVARPVTAVSGDSLLRGILTVLRDETVQDLLGSRDIIKRVASGGGDEGQASGTPGSSPLPAAGVDEPRPALIAHSPMTLTALPSAASVPATALASWVAAAAPSADGASARIVDVTMCNPPFFSSWEEAQASMAGNARSTCAGTASQMVTPGGEEAFILRMVEESSSTSADRRSALWFSSMVGKHSTLAVITSELRRRGAPTVRVCTLVQGRTRRWVVAWSWHTATDFFAEGWRFVDESGAGTAAVAMQSRSSREANAARRFDVADAAGETEPWWPPSPSWLVQGDDDGIPDDDGDSGSDGRQKLTGGGSPDHGRACDRTSVLPPTAAATVEQLVAVAPLSGGPDHLNPSCSEDARTAVESAAAAAASRYVAAQLQGRPLLKRPRVEHDESTHVAGSTKTRDAGPSNVRAVLANGAVANLDSSWGLAGVHFGPAAEPALVGRHAFLVTPSETDARVIARLLQEPPVVAAGAAEQQHLPPPLSRESAAAPHHAAAGRAAAHASVDIVASIEAVLRERPPAKSDPLFAVASWRVQRPLVWCLPGGGVNGTTGRLVAALRGVAFTAVSGDVAAGDAAAAAPPPDFRFEVHVYCVSAGSTDGGTMARFLVCTCWIAGMRSARGAFERLADRVTGSIQRTGRRWRRAAAAPVVDL